jgi:dienelactone hydrolase
MLAMNLSATAACDDSKYRSEVVTYKFREEFVSRYGDTRCLYYTHPFGSLVCRIRMRGTLYYPLAADYAHPGNKPAPTFPALLVNHGSEETFEADNKFCEIAEYFVPKGYIVFVPFRRGQGDPDEGEGNMSTGVYVEDLLDDWQNGTGNYVHTTNCTNRSCYKAQLLKEQADEEIADFAVSWLKLRNDVKKDADDPQNRQIAIVGISYGGAVTVFANRHNIGQKAAVAFSPGAQQWDPNVNCVSGDPNCGTDFQRELISAAGSADKPAYYLQARWDYDTRATIDLAYAHAYQSADPQHSRGWNAAIFPYINPCVTDEDPTDDIPPQPRPCTDDDYQSIHAGFFKDANEWGPTVIDFLKRYLK